MDSIEDNHPQPRSLQQMLDSLHVPGRHDSRVGDDQHAFGSEFRRERANFFDRAGPEDEPCARLIIKGAEACRGRGVAVEAHEQCFRRLQGKAGSIGADGAALA